MKNIKPKLGFLISTLASLIGIAAMLWTMHRANFFSIGDPIGIIAPYSIALIAPSLIIGWVTWRSRTYLSSNLLSLSATSLLSVVPIACYDDQYTEGSQYLLALSPVYLWFIVFIFSMASIFVSRLQKR
ncbi:MAG: hypothetical protein HC858_07180 [Brachymonas sp.]|nr:hypothetical protein [Brachymonas sp.]